MSRREIRFRRLVALYPRDFRAEYGDEMLGVLLADDRPVRAQAAGLVTGAIAARFRPTLGGGEWRQAARVVQLFGAIMLLALAVRRVPVFVLWTPFHVDTPWRVDEVVDASWTVDVFDLVRLVAWAAVVAAAVVGLRGLAVTAALVGLVGEIATAAQHYLDIPAMMIDRFWFMVAAAVVVIASATANGRRPRGWIAIVLAGLAPIAQGVSSFALYSLFGRDYSMAYSLMADRFLLLVPAVLVVVGVLRIRRPAVRRRVVACAVPVLAVFPVDQAFSGFKMHNQLHPEGLWLISPLEWAAMVLIPLAAFAVAAWLNMRLERSRGAAWPVPAS